MASSIGYVLIAGRPSPPSKSVKTVGTNVDFCFSFAVASTDKEDRQADALGTLPFFQIGKTVGANVESCFFFFFFFFFLFFLFLLLFFRFLPLTLLGDCCQSVQSSRFEVFIFISLNLKIP